MGSAGQFWLGKCCLPWCDSGQWWGWCQWWCGVRAWVMVRESPSAWLWVSFPICRRQDSWVEGRSSPQPFRSQCWRDGTFSWGAIGKKGPCNMQLCWKSTKELFSRALLVLEGKWQPKGYLLLVWSFPMLWMWLEAGHLPLPQILAFDWVPSSHKQCCLTPSSPPDGNWQCLDCGTNTDLQIGHKPVFPILSNFHNENAPMILD